MPPRGRGVLSQIHTLLSRPHVASNAPDGAHATDLTSFSWPSSVAIRTYSATRRGARKRSHPSTPVRPRPSRTVRAVAPGLAPPLAFCRRKTSVVASKLAVASSRESGEKATLRTVRLWHSSRVPHPVHWSPTLVHNLTCRRESRRTASLTRCS